MPNMFFFKTLFTTGLYRFVFINLVIFALFSTSFVTSVPATAFGFYNFFRSTLNICSTPKCQETASLLRANMDFTVQPCVNFYRFACGNFVKHAVIPDDRMATEISFSYETERIYSQLKNSIEEELKKDDPRSFGLVKEFYETCMDEDEINKNSVKEFQQMLNKLGGWPVIVGKSWNDTYFNWMETELKFRKDGNSVNYFIKFSYTQDQKNTSRYRMHMYPPDLGILKGYLIQGRNFEIVKAYFKYMVDLAEILGADPKQAKKELSDSLDFEIELAKIARPAVESQNPDDYYNPMTIEDLQTRYPGIPYLDLLSQIVSPHNSVSSEDIVIVSFPNYFGSLVNLLSQTPKRVQANYAFWRLVQESSSYLDERVLEAQRQFASVLSGNTTLPPRWMTCLANVEAQFPTAFGALYVRKHFDQDKKISANEMILNIRKSFQGMLAGVSWMDNETKSEAQNKLEHMRQFVGYPDELFDNEKLDSYYESLKLDRKSFLKSDLNIKLFLRDRLYEQIGKPVNKSYWIEHSSTTKVNAFYKWVENSIQFPAAILNGVFFDKDRPKYMNYGGIGFIIGHEITHGFDNIGRHFDKNGNMVDWWAKTTANEYLRRTKCMVNQYSSYTVREVGLRVNGMLTLGENIADNGGIKQAYNAYEVWEKENGVEPRLPGMEIFTPRQLFWISSANLWCTKQRPEHLRNLMLTDPHTPNEYRVIGTLSNTPEFSRDFHCPIGSPMNPPLKCTVW